MEGACDLRDGPVQVLHVVESIVGDYGPDAARSEGEHGGICLHQGHLSQEAVLSEDPLRIRHRSVIPVEGEHPEPLSCQHPGQACACTRPQLCHQFSSVRNDRGDHFPLGDHPKRFPL